MNPYPVRGKQRDRVRMTDAEVEAFLREERTISMSTLLQDGTIHSVAMWYGFAGDRIGVLTKRKSQKVQNLLRDPRMTCLVEAGDTYAQLRGVELVGHADITEDAATLRALAISLHERHVGPYSEESAAALESSVYNRVAIIHSVHRVVSWDHRKLSA